MNEIINGKQIAEQIKQNLKQEISQLNSKPGLAVILVGDNPNSIIYTSLKEKACEEVGIYSKIYKFKKEIKEQEIIDLIKELNQNPKINGILVQLPLPKNLNQNKVINSLSPEKDVDGLHPLNLGKLSSNQSTIIPCTPKAIIKVLDFFNIDLQGKNIVIINRSNVVGKPLANLFLKRNATVTLCHSKTQNLEKHTQQADILISATGSAGLISSKMVKPGVVIVSLGISRDENNKIKGDVEENAKEKASYFVPVLGGIGPMTIAMLLENTLQVYKTQKF
jgi:methylenetetrahydrofolate dehydrogenase (NADP+)/methenyltetrahydrofolate cyclohydrolase